MKNSITVYFRQNSNFLKEEREGGRISMKIVHNTFLNQHIEKQGKERQRILKFPLFYLANEDFQSFKNFSAILHLILYIP